MSKRDIVFMTKANGQSIVDSVETQIITTLDSLMAAVSDLRAKIDTGSNKPIPEIPLPKIWGVEHKDNTPVWAFESLTTDALMYHLINSINKYTAIARECVDQHRTSCLGEAQPPWGSRASYQYISLDAAKKLISLLGRVEANLIHPHHAVRWDGDGADYFTGTVLLVHGNTLVISQIIKWVKDEDHNYFKRYPLDRDTIQIKKLDVCRVVWERDPD